MPDFTFDVSDLLEVKFNKGDTVLEEGKPGELVYVLKEGAVRVETAGRELCKINEPLTIFGEISVLLETEHTADVIAEDDSTFYVIKDLVGYLRGSSEASLHVAKILATRVVNMNNTFVEVKNEIEQLQARGETGPSFRQGLLRIVQKMDEFWGRDIWDPMGARG